MAGRVTASTGYEGLQATAKGNTVSKGIRELARVSSMLCKAKLRPLCLHLHGWA